jgi:hypothetical protein
MTDDPEKELCITKMYTTDSTGLQGHGDGNTTIWDLVR